MQEKAIDSVGEDMMVWINLYSNQLSVKYLCRFGTKEYGFFSKVGSLELMGPL